MLIHIQLNNLESFTLLFKVHSPSSVHDVGNSVVGLGVATDTGWHWGGIGTIRTNVTALGGLQDGYQ